jgi:4-hydroxy-tetrahydrodipicolinate reductase
MGQIIERLASTHDCRVAGFVTQASRGDLETKDFGQVDVVIDFSAGPAVKENLRTIAERGWNVVIGTTGWQGDLAGCQTIAAIRGIGVLTSANFSMGMHMFRLIVQEAARRFATMPDVGAWIHESHHAAKKDAPSGTALLLKAAMEEAGYARDINVSSTRAGSIPGTHEIGFDAQTESVTLVHQVRNRAVFAHGALEAAQWLKGKRGWFSMEDMLGN